VAAFARRRIAVIACALFTVIARDSSSRLTLALDARFGTVTLILIRTISIVFASIQLAVGAAITRYGISIITGFARLDFSISASGWRKTALTRVITNTGHSISICTWRSRRVTLFSGRA
jgi:ABC-type antimicrobial peptide transport system permease subunit